MTDVDCGQQRTVCLCQGDFALDAITGDCQQLIAVLCVLRCTQQLPGVIMVFLQIWKLLELIVLIAILQKITLIDLMTVCYSGLVYLGEQLC